MTVTDYVRKHATIARDRGTAQAAGSAVEEATAKLLLRPYLRHRQATLRRELPAQRDLLDELRGRDRWCLLVFDAGRYDYMAPLLRDRYRGEVRRTFSAARDTFEWISTTWRGDYDDVTYLSGMVPVSDEIPDFDLEDFRRLYGGVNPGDSIGEIVKLWETHWDTGIGTVTPEAITDAALEYADRDKLVVHFNQPHSPFIGTPALFGHRNNRSATPKRGRPNDEPIWHRVRAGEVSDAYLRMAYWGNAARAIDAVDPLVRERETVIATADHGEALGEYGMYTHDRAPHPKRREVPWQVITGVRDRDYSAADTETLDEKLQALGYR